MRIIEFGNTPPPYGGVSVHISRLLSRLHLDGFDLIHVTRRMSVNECDLQQIRWPTFPRYINHIEFFRGIGYPFGCGILHLHENPIFYAPLVALHITRGGRAIITIHDQFISNQLAKALPHERMAFKYVVKSDRVRWIAVSMNVKAILGTYGVPSSRISVIPAFLSKSCDSCLPGNSKEMLKFVAEHKPVMIVYGFKRIFIKGGDLYGFDYAVKILREAVQIEPRAGLIIFCPGASTKDGAWKSLMKYVHSIGLAANVFYIFETMNDTYPLWKICSVMVRPSISDGDSIAIREMLSLGLPVIASDVTPRPEGTLVLPLASPLDWSRAVIQYHKNIYPKPMSNSDDGYPLIKNVLCLLMKDS